jgi:acetone carboxylase gamma subunit
MPAWAGGQVAKRKVAPNCAGVGRKVAPSGPRVGVAREVICPDCHRLVAIDSDGRLLPHAKDASR